MRGLLFLLSLTVMLCARAEAPNPLHKKNAGPPLKNTPKETGTDGDEDEDEDEDESRPEPLQAKPKGAAATNGQCSAPTVDAFVQITSNSRPQPAPDGTVYFVSDRREAPQLFSISSPMGLPKQISYFPDGISYFALSPDGKKLLLAKDNQGNEQYDIYLYEIATASLKPLLTDANKRIESVSWSMDNSWFAYTSNARNQIDFDLYKYDVASGKSTLLTELSGTTYLSDVSPDNKKIAFTSYRSVTDSSVHFFDLTANRVKDIGPKAEKGTVAELAATFTRDSQNIFFLSDKDTGLHQIYRASVAGTSPIKQYTAERQPVESLDADIGRTAIIYTVNRDGASSLGGFEIDRDGQKKKLLILPPLKKEVVSSASLRRDAKGLTLFYSQSDSRTPSNIYSWSHPKRKVWTQSAMAGVSPECFDPMQFVSYPTFDGGKVPAMLYLPRKAPTPIPFLVYAHGGPEVQARPTFSKVFQYYVSRGFGVLVPNVRGSMGYGREYTLKDNYKLRMDSVKDLVAGAEWLTKQNFARKGEIGILGGSYGGFMVLRTIQVAPEYFGAAAESVGITNFVTFLKNTKAYRRALREVEYGPLTDEEFLKSISPATYVENIKTPLLIFHGANDPRVPVSETEALTAALKQKQIPVEAHIFGDEGHGNTKLKNILEQTKLTAYFFEKNLVKSKKGLSSF